MKVAFCLFGLALAGLGIAEPQPSRQDGPAAPDAPADAGKKPESEKKAKGADAGRDDRATFKEFSGLLSRLIVTMKSDSLGVDKAVEITGLKLSKDAVHSNIYFTFHQSDRYDFLWGYGFREEGKPKPKGQSGSKFLEAIELRVPEPISPTKGSMLLLNLREETRFTVADFNAYFQQTAFPELPAHPVPLVEKTLFYTYRLDEMKVGLNCDMRVGFQCDKETGFCRSIALDTVRKKSPDPETGKQ